MFQAMKKEGYVTAPLDRFLFEQANKPNDRAVNVNAPSQAGKCNRANYYMRMQYENDGSIDPRTQRIFDNGTYNIIIDSILHAICERHINKKPYDDTIATYLKTQFLACGYDCNITFAKGETIRYDICL